MRKILFLLAAVLALAACNKESIQPGNAEVTGQVLYGGDPAADGIGYYIRTDNDHAALSPQNLPAEFKHITVDAHVAIRYFDTGATMNTQLAPGATGPRIVVLRSIRNL
ncbi:MAG TPA: lipoprotein [Puia sp.]|nr:lipoprotein [Puia sp.]